MITLTNSPADIKRAAKILKDGGLAVFPTETVYGLGADAYNTQALAKVFEVKGRPLFDPLIVHIASLKTLDHLTCPDALDSQRHQLLEKLVNVFWPGPLTLVLPKKPELPGLLSAGLPTVAIRFPSHLIAQSLISLSTGAVAAPSANRFGRLSPTRAEHVVESLGDNIDCIIDGGPCTVGVESTVMELIPAPRILRPGGISREQLEEVIGPVACCGFAEDILCDQADSAKPSPGMLQSHYAPEIPLFLHGHEEMANLSYNGNEGYLFFSGKSRDVWLINSTVQTDNCTKPKTIFVLSESGDTTEAAANLFEYLHILNKSGASCIHAETLPEEGLGRAVNDRLRKAAQRPALCAAQKAADE